MPPGRVPAFGVTDPLQSTCVIVGLQGFFCARARGGPGSERRGPAELLGVPLPPNWEGVPQDGIIRLRGAGTCVCSQFSRRTVESEVHSTRSHSAAAPHTAARRRRVRHAQHERVVQRVRERRRQQVALGRHKRGAKHAADQQLGRRERRRVRGSKGQRRHADLVFCCGVVFLFLFFELRQSASSIKSP